jgi:nitroimidazol reductase NimA-like FMN-containing flavoprotein (pyridoxamine 5'-phosphate oxidase superfamily)
MQPTAEQNLDGYGTPAIDWSRVDAVIRSDILQAPDTGGPNRHTSWLATANADGSPHVMPVGALWVEDAYYFTSGPGTRKSRNLVSDPRCVITIATHEFDLVVEGEAAKVTDQDELERVARAFGEGDWHPEVRDGAFFAEFSAPSAGPPPWHVYRVRPKTIYALGTTEPYGATRWEL